MLQSISIRHFAIIDTLDLEFKKGLNILSGETGAGKSIIMQALNLLLGGRAYLDLIRSGHEECEVSAEFDISAPVAAAAITGTVLRLSVGSDSLTKLKVYSGEVHITNAPDKKKELTPKFLVPREVPGPVEIPGPTEVTVDEWLYIVKAMQQITLDKTGKVVSKGIFGVNDPDENSDWIRWNKSRDRK